MKSRRRIIVFGIAAGLTVSVLSLWAISFHAHVGLILERVNRYGIVLDHDVLIAEYENKTDLRWVGRTPSIAALPFRTPDQFPRVTWQLPPMTPSANVALLWPSRCYSYNTTMVAVLGTPIGQPLRHFTYGDRLNAWLLPAWISPTGLLICLGCIAGLVAMRHRGRRRR